MMKFTTPEEDKYIEDLYTNYNKFALKKESENLIVNSSKEIVNVNELYHPNEPWIQTYTGKRFNPLNPMPETIDIEDIAHALSNLCRFTGHVSVNYTVAHHSLLVSYLCNEENALQGLLHDGTEAYINDISSPIKNTPEFVFYREIESRLQKAIYEKFSLPEKEAPDVKKADLQILATEARDLMVNLRSDFHLKYKPLPFKIVPMTHDESKKMFLERFYELIK